MKTACCLALFIFAVSAEADTWSLSLFSSDPKEVLAAAAQHTPPADANVFILDYAVSVQIGSDGKLRQTTKSVQRILTEAGAHADTQVVVPWLAWRQDRPQIRARVITPDGQAHLLESSTITEASVPALVPGIFTDTKLLTVPLPAVAAGSVVEVEYIENDREAITDFGRSGQFPIPQFIPFEHYSLRIEAPASSKLSVAAYGLPNAKRKETKTGDKQQITIETSALPKQSPQKLLPPDVLPTPTVVFSTVSSWGEVARWYAGIMGKVAVPKPITAPWENDTDRITKIEPILEQIDKKVRYTGIELGMGAYTPRTPSETWARGYGDCKDKVALLINKLAEAGIPAFAALLRPAPFPDVRPDMPGLEAFNHVIVYVPGKHPLWIDPTAEFTPASHLPVSDANRWALIADPATQAPVRTSASDAADNHSTESTEVLLQEEGPAKVVGTIEARGTLADAMRPGLNFAASTPEPQRQKFLDALAKNIHVEHVTKLDAGQPHDLLRPARMQLSAEGYTLAQTNDRAATWVLPSVGTMNFRSLAPLLAEARRPSLPESKSTADDRPRTEDYFVAPGFTEEEHYHVVPPAGFRLGQAPTLTPVAIGPLTVMRTAKLLGDGSLEVKYQFTSPKAQYTAAEGKAMIADFKKVLSAPPTQVVFPNVAQGMIAEGKVKEGIALLKQQADTNPSGNGAKLRMVSAYLEAGARPEAVRLCREVIARDPKSALAYNRLGWIYTHDEFGRPFRPGMDWTAAETAFKKAVELKPEEKTYGIDLGILYEFDKFGNRFEPDAPLSDAIARFEQAGVAALAATNRINELPETLLYARRFDAVKQFYENSEATHASPAWRLAAFAASSGPEAALSEAERLLPSEDARAAREAEAGRLLLALGEYKAAAVLLARGKNTNAGSADIDLQTVGDIKRFKDGDYSSQPAVALVQRLVFALLPNVVSQSDQWQSLVAPEWQILGKDHFRNGLFRSFTGFRSLGGQSLPFAVVADYIVSTANLTQDCYDDSNCRVRFADPSDNGRIKTVAFAAKRNNRWLVLGLGSDWAVPGNEAFSRAKANDGAGAKHWLDWAKEEIPESRSSDPMAAPAFVHLWASPSEEDTDLITAAAASLVARGKDYEKGNAELGAVCTRLNTSDLKNFADQALAQSLMMHRKYTQAIPVLQRLHKAWPESGQTAYDLGMALALAGKMEEAKQEAEVLASDEKTAMEGNRLRFRILAAQGQYKEAAAAQAKVCADAKATPADWNELAWISLFASEPIAGAKDAATKAVHLTKGNNASLLHTLALVQADTGQIKEAKENIYRVMNFLFDANDDALTVFGRIAEQLDLKQLAAAYYGRVREPQGSTTLSNYTYAQSRLKRLHY